MNPSYSINEKLTTQDLANIIAEKHAMNKKEAELFIKGMFDLIEEALTTEKYVKVKGLGIFKLTEVDSRESINISTGERIEIQGHTKISFTPDTSLKELINKPFSHFETVILNEGVQLEDTKLDIEQESFVEKAEEKEEDNKVLLPEENTIVVEEKDDTIIEEPIQEIETEVEPETMIEETSVEENIVEENVVEENIVEENVVEETIMEETTPIMEEITEKREEVKKEKLIEIIEEEIEEKKESQLIETKEAISSEPINEVKNDEPIANIEVEEKEDGKEEEKTNKGLILITIILILIIIGGGYWLFQPTNNTEVPSETESVKSTETIEDKKKDTLNQESNSGTIINIEAIKTDNKISISSDEKVASISDTTDYIIVGTQATHTLQKGETIIKVALKYFGAKNYWPYIAKHNEKTIKNANNVPVGTQLSIPKLSPKK